VAAACERALLPAQNAPNAPTAEVALAASASPVSITTESPMSINAGIPRSVQTLPATWKFQLDQDVRGESENWFAPSYDRSGWGSVTVPGAWDVYDAALWGYEGVAWYAVEFPAAWTLTAAWQRLTFGRVMYQARVWLNGQFLGEHNNGYLPFEYAASANLRTNQPNLLVVRVDNAPRDEWLTGSRVIEWVQYGGILQPVALVSTSRSYLSDVTINATPNGAGGVVNAVVKVTNTSASPLSGNVQLAVGAQTQQVSVSCPAQSTVTVTLTLNMAQASAWSPASPTLYTANVSLNDAGGLLDQVNVRFGVRRITVSGRQILLNGAPVQVKGVNRYDEYTGYGPVVPADVLRADLLRIKQTGANMIRVHYPHDPIELDMMDEIGLLALEEVPLNWWGVDWWGPPPNNGGPIIDAAEQALIDMVGRDKNHPCIVMWSMCNECATHLPEGIAAVRRLMTKARQLDATRLVTFVAGSDVAQHPAFDAADVVCTNLYFGLFSGARAQHLADMPTLVTQATQNFLQGVKNTFGNKPWLVTEFGAHGLYALHGDARMTQEYQAAYIQAAWNAITSVPEVQGGLLWAWADYHHRRDFYGKASGDNMLLAPYGPYGAVTGDRREKKAITQLTLMFGSAAQRKVFIPLNKTL
jgi:beta-glucuronidase